MVSWGWGISLWCRSIRLGLRVDWDTLVGNISNISINMVSGILDNLGTAIGKSNSVRSRHNTISIRSFTSVESSLGVVIGHSIFISVWFRSSLLFNIWGRGMVSWSCMDNRGMVSGSSNNRGMVSWS